MAHQPCLGPSEVESGIKPCQIGAQAQCGPYQTCRHLHYSDSQPASNSRDFPSPAYPTYFTFDDPGPFSADHHPSHASDLHRLAKSDYPYDPRLFDVGAQFFPAASPAPATTAAAAATSTPPDGLALTPFHPSFTWQYPDSHVRPQLEIPVSMVHSTSHLGSMPAAPGMSNFEPMMTTCEMQGAPPTAIQIATPLTSPGLSSVANQSPASSVMPSFSRKSSYNGHGGPRPQESLHILPNSQLNLHFEHISAPGMTPTPGDPLIPTSSTSEPSRSQVSTSKKRKTERTTTTKKAAIKTNSASSKKTNSKTKTSPASVSKDSKSPTTSTSERTRTVPSRSHSRTAVLDGNMRPTSASPVESPGQGSDNKGSYFSDEAMSPPDPSLFSATQRNRNRNAATKCRAKTKLVEAQLEATERTMSAQNSELSAQVMDLREQVFALKSELLRHGHCDCEIIQRYLTNEAIKIGGGGGGGAGVAPNTGTGQHVHIRKRR